MIPDNEDEITQIYALNTIFFATNGTNWRVRDRWTGPTAVCGAEPDNSWYGVTCNADSQVVEIDLEENDLFGQLPSEIRALVTLGKSSETVDSGIGSKHIPHGHAL